MPPLCTAVEDAMAAVVEAVNAPGTESWSESTLNKQRSYALRKQKAKVEKALRCATDEIAGRWAREHNKILEAEEEAVRQLHASLHKERDLAARRTESSVRAMQLQATASAEREVVELARSYSKQAEEATASAEAKLREQREKIEQELFRAEKALRFEYAEEMLAGQREHERMMEGEKIALEHMLNNAEAAAANGTIAGGKEGEEELAAMLAALTEEGSQLETEVTEAAEQAKHLREGLKQHHEMQLAQISHETEAIQEHWDASKSVLAQEEASIRREITGAQAIGSDIEKERRAFKQMLEAEQRRALYLENARAREQTRLTAAAQAAMQARVERERAAARRARADGHISPTSSSPAADFGGPMFTATAIRRPKSRSPSRYSSRSGGARSSPSRANSRMSGVSRGTLGGGGGSLLGASPPPSRGDSGMEQQQQQQLPLL